MSAFSDRIETYRKENNITEIMVPVKINNSKRNKNEL